MKILHLIYDDLQNPWLGGGGAVRTYEIYKRLANRHEITILTGNYPGAKTIDKENIHYHRIGSSRSYVLSLVTFSLKSPRLIKNLDYDIVIEDFNPFSPCFASLHTGRTSIASIQNVLSTHAIKKYPLGFIPYLFELGLNKYKNFIVVSKSIANELKNTVLRNPPEKLEIIPNGVDETLFKLVSKEENFILFLGRIDIYQKGLDTLIDAFVQVEQSTEDIRLIIAGGGKDVKALQKLISKTDSGNIEYLGRVSEHHKRGLLSRCLFVCMPSRYEAWPLVATEAGACGKPVVGNDIPGLRDTVQHMRTGFLVKPGDSYELSEAILSLLNSDMLRRKLGRNGRKWAQNFRWDKVAEEQEKFYYECLLARASLRNI